MSHDSTSSINSIDFQPPPWRLIFRQSMPHLPLVDRFFARVLIAGCHGHLHSVEGLENIRPENDPFILVMNHNKKLESVLLPTFFVMMRSGRHIHFLADWNFMLIPGVGYVMRRGRVIPVTRKPARPAFLNVFKPLFRGKESSLTRARRMLESGRSLGLFPEGRINRSVDTLLPGNQGAARLSLKTKTPIVVAGITFPEAEPDAPLPRRTPMRICINPPMMPSPELLEGRLSQEKVGVWHDQVMNVLATLCKKSYVPADRSDAIDPVPSNR